MQQLSSSLSIKLASKFSSKWTSRQQGYAFGLLGVFLFSGGIPATRLAVLELPAIFVGAGRAMVAGLLAAVLLLLVPVVRPTRRDWAGLVIVAFGAVFAYPILSAVALQHMSSNHATLISALMPLMTAMFGAYLGKQRLKPGFWWCAVASSALVISYNLSQQQASAVSIGDATMFFACLCCGLAYAKGALLAKTLGSWQVICWALVLSLPITMPLTLWQLLQIDVSTVSAGGWYGFAYLALFSMFLGFFAWYKGLALGGVAQVSQLQQLSPFLAIFWAHWWLGELILPMQIGVAVLLVSLILLGRRLA